MTMSAPQVKCERSSSSSSPQPAAGSGDAAMKEEVSTPSPTPHIPTTPRGPPSPTYSSEVEAARQQLTSMIQGLPLLSMLPALHRLAPGKARPRVPSLSCAFISSADNDMGNCYFLNYFICIYI